MTAEGDAPVRVVAAAPRAPAWSSRRYLLAALLATVGALAMLAWVQPSLFTSIVVLSGNGHRFAEPVAGAFYAERVAAILEKECAGCHGPRLQRARLRLDSLGDIRLGGKNGPVIVPGDPRASTLYTRLLLPRGDKRAMPAGNKPPLAQDELRVIELWIAHGASGATPVGGIKDAPPPPSPPVVVAESDAAAVAHARAPLREALRTLGDRYPGSIRYVSRDGAALTVGVQHLGTDFSDADLARFESVAAEVVRLDLSGTAITDAAGPTLANFSRLEYLRLDGTAIGDKALAALVRMPALKILTLTHTNTSHERIVELRRTGMRVYDGRD